MAKTAAVKTLFLVDAMNTIFRAYFAPMSRLNNAQGIPTKVPYLFSNMLRKIMKEYSPDYLAVVFDTREPTFRDKLFDKYEARREPRPGELAGQMPSGRRRCEAMRLPILEFDGFEADDVMGALAKQAEKAGLEVSLVTGDKDMMQLVRGKIRVLRPGSGPNKTGTIGDEAKVEEIMGVPPEKVADVMALMGDSIDNIPGAKGIGEKGARELSKRFGSAEAALERASEVEVTRYREALETSREAVLLSKQLAIIDTAAPVKLVLDDLTRRDPDVEALRALYAELGFTSLLRDLPAATTAGATVDDTATIDTPAALKKYLKALPRGKEVSLWLTLDPGQRDCEGFGTRVVGIEISPRAGVARTAWLSAAESTFALKGSDEKPQPQEHDRGEMLALLHQFLKHPTTPKIVHKPQIFDHLNGPAARDLLPRPAVSPFP